MTHPKGYIIRYSLVYNQFIRSEQGALHPTLSHHDQQQLPLQRSSSMQSAPLYRDSEQADQSLHSNQSYGRFFKINFNLIYFRNHFKESVETFWNF